ncbi:hypothetical protein [Flavisolibacter ginsenosidimutans]|uniref:Uncharacterized protein n=1 Tax=Flavisolibacter ginsenosidimutans TaxID=661481 RepID=A0A5B8UNK9_9BACT|nr:hypothetical protein [Flavisolibacter ginsenosidimutans]QEC57962.1 hypothetical protein FSB75_19300 [Flavisolibacter ginsenosidimutans]
MQSRNETPPTKPDTVSFLYDGDCAFGIFATHFRGERVVLGQSILQIPGQQKEKPPLKEAFQVGAARTKVEPAMRGLNLLARVVDCGLKNLY